MSAVAASPLLAVERVSVGYDAALVLRGASFEVRRGEFVALLGPSGAGKTTLLRAIVGLLPIRDGAIRLETMRLDGLAPYRIAALGVTAIPEGRRLFDELTVRENLLLGAYLPAARRHAAETLALVERLFPTLRERARDPAAVLSGGEQQMVALGRGLMARPRLLLLDDPFLGLAKPVVGPFCAALRELTDAWGLTILAAGQHVRRLLRLAHHGYLLDEGRVMVEGLGAALLDDPRVRRTLLELPP
ncbi:MAG: ABC transporter ATP-binding protein [Candidatus Rokubacteria bacterium]|nr:ABC transporter ATP-binding protein [Candidatus Rokubacteria bacterium]